jgi:hypothetical protein
MNAKEKGLNVILLAPIPTRCLPINILAFPIGESSHLA